VVDGSGAGGGGIYIWDPGGLYHHLSWHVPAGRICSSYRAESVAFLEALHHAVPTNTRSAIRLCTDSLSLLQRLSGGPGKQTDSLTQEIWHLLSGLSLSGTCVQLVWVPGHAGLRGNEAADKEANLGTALHQHNSPIDINTSLSSIKHYIRTQVLAHTYSTIRPDHFHKRCTEGRPIHFSSSTPKKVSNAIHQLRANNSSRLPATLLRWKRVGATGRCQFCDHLVGDAEHLILHCPEWDNQRNQLDITSLTVLEEPNTMAEFLDMIGWWQHHPDMA
jgi:ribonuclease HI